MTLPNISNRESFSKDVEQFVIRTGTDYMDAILHICEQRNIEPETAAKLINTNIKNMLERQASDQNLLNHDSVVSDEIEFE
jgi:hypothetical protein